MARDLFQRRILTLIAIGLFLISGLVIRLIDVQALNAADYTARVDSELYVVSTQLAPRGEITDINGVPFARSIGSINVVVDQTMVKDPEKIARIALVSSCQKCHTSPMESIKGCIL
jgi:cell division protein FtsI (penicillin-binding protein 3)